MIKTILKTCLLSYVFLITSSTASVVEMKCTGALMHHVNILYDLRDDNKLKCQYQFPNLDRQKNPQHVIVLKTDQTSTRTIQIYKFVDFMKGMLENIQPVFKYPQEQKPEISGPDSDLEISSGTPYCFHQGLYYLIKNQELWHIYQGNKSIPLYKGDAFPWFFQKSGKLLTYSIGNMVFNSSKSVFYSGNYNIISYDLPGNDYKLINYYNADHNPDIALHIGSKIYRIKDNASELYPRFSNNKEYFAYFRNSLDQKDVWDIIVSKTASPKIIIAEIPNVKMYDINETAFFYHDSFQWLDNCLYYMKQNSPLTIFAYSPKKQSYRRFSFLGNTVGRTTEKRCKEMTHIKKSITVTLDIMSTDWFQVAINDKGKLMFIIECLIRTMSNCSCNNHPFGFIEPVRRIVIFQ